MKTYLSSLKKTAAVFFLITGTLLATDAVHAAGSSSKAKDSGYSTTEKDNPQVGFLGKEHITELELLAVFSLVGLSVLTPELLNKRKKRVSEANASRKGSSVTKLKKDSKPTPVSNSSAKANKPLTQSEAQKDLMNGLQKIIQEEIENPKKNETLKVSFLNGEMPDQVSSPSSEEKAEESTSKILIVDDSSMVREMLALTFQTAGYQTEQAVDGQEALEKLRAGLSCKLILSDIEMPRMDGLELLIRLREDEKLASIPVAMLTSYGDQKLQRIASQRGAKGYFIKPYIEAAMIDAANRLIEGEVLISKVENQEVA